MTTALVLIDIQMGFKSPIWGARNNPEAEDNAAKLLEANASTNWCQAAATLKPQQIHNTAVSHLHGEFVTARSTSDILADLT